MEKYNLEYCKSLGKKNLYYAKVLISDYDGKQRLISTILLQDDSSSTNDKFYFDEENSEISNDRIVELVPLLQLIDESDVNFVLHGKRVFIDVCDTFYQLSEDHSDNTSEFETEILVSKITEFFNKENQRKRIK